MNGIEKYQSLIEEIDFVLAENRSLRSEGIHLIVEHLDHEPGTICAPGEMIGKIQLAGPTLHPFGFSYVELLLVDCFCRYRMPLSATNIEQIMDTDPFYVHYAANRNGRKQCVARPDRRSVRTYVPRICNQMGRLFAEAGLHLDPLTVLVSQEMDSKTVAYRLKASVSFVHILKSGPRN